MCMVCRQQREYGLERFGGERCVMKAAGYKICEGAETGFYLRYLGGVGFDKGGVGGEPL